MFSLQNMPSASSMFSAYASMTGTMMLVRSMVNELVPYPVRTYLVSTLRYLFMARSSELTLVIEERNGMVCNEVYDASETYLCTKVSPDAKRLKITKAPKEKNLTIRFEKGEKFVDCFEGIELSWRFVIFAESENSNDPSNSRSTEKRYFELSFDVKHKEKVLESYLPFVLHKSKTIKDEEREVKLYTLGSRQYTGGRVLWESINLQHPSTFDTLAMDHEEKKSIMEDLDRFVRRKEFYKRVGKAWKRGYLLYGPPGTGKSSLIAAMANYLKFDVYDLQLANVIRDSELRNLLLATTNRSILVIEDIDCSLELPDRQLQVNGRKFPDVQVTLSGLLNFIDGLWSSCGDERIIVFTTNHKEKLDPALLRPGRMDLHIHMSYCTPCGFKLLAANYLGIKDHELFGEIEEAIRTTEVTPAEVAEQLMKSDEPEIALGGLIEFLRMKKKENEDVKAKQAEQALVDKEKQGEQQDEGVKEKK